MPTITKKELIDRIAENAGSRRVQVKKVIQQFLDAIVDELGKGNRLEFRDFGVFESKLRKGRKAQNPKTLEPVLVPPKRTVKFRSCWPPDEAAPADRRRLKPPGQIIEQILMARESEYDGNDRCRTSLAFAS